MLRQGQLTILWDFFRQSCNVMSIQSTEGHTRTEHIIHSQAAIYA